MTATEQARKRRDQIASVDQHLTECHAHIKRAENWIEDGNHLHSGKYLPVNHPVFSRDRKNQLLKLL